MKVLEVSPALIAHDLHDDAYASHFARELARQRGIPLLGVQHHHAHIAAILAEHHVTEPVYALALDGGGVGSDGLLWGGELLRVTGAHFDRLGQVKPLRIFGDEIESRVPWRLAASVLHALGRGDEIAQRFAAQPAAAALAAIMNDPRQGRPTSSLGRIVDAAASLLGINDVSLFRGEAGLMLEGKAAHAAEVAPLPDGWVIEDGMLDLMPLLGALADEKNQELGAARFHATLIAALTDWLCSVAPEGSTVAAGGGCFLNQVLARGLHERLADCDRHLIEARRVPPSDAGLALGQTWIAQQYLLHP